MASISHKKMASLGVETPRNPLRIQRDIDV